jgi:hypothetical protein
MKKILLAIPTLIIGGQLALADIVYVTARPQGCISTPSCPGANSDGTYSEVNFPTLGDFGAVGTASGHPQTTVARTYISSAFYNNTEGGVNLTPTLGVPGGTYQIDYNFNSVAGNTSTNIIMSVTASSATLSFTETDKLQRKYGNPANQWQTMGYLTNDVGSATPTIQFRYLSGAVSGAGTPSSAANRLLFDCWRFTLVEPCLSVPVVSVTGPLSTNANQVVVSGVSASATNIFVYQDSGAGMVLIGSKTSAVTAGNNTVTVVGLVKNARVAATQMIDGQEGCAPTSGTLVGGGANPQLRATLSIKETTDAGPAGTPATDTSSTSIHFLGSAALLGSAGTVSGAPAGGTVIYPSNTWQTITFLRGTNELVGDATDVIGVTADGNGYLANDMVSIQVYAYRILPNGIKIFSASPTTSLDATSNDVFTVNWSWSAVPDAAGYKLLRSVNFGGYNESIEVAASNYADANTGWVADATVTPTTAQSAATVRWSPSLANTNDLPGQWGILESINFVIEDLADTGPYELYLDNLKNGETLIQDFEAAPAKSTDYGFRAPGFSGTTSGNLLSAPDQSIIANSAADTGMKSMNVRFQWSGTNNTRWLRLTTSGVGNPLVNLDEPISFRLLLLPLNATLPTPPPAPDLTVNQTGAELVLNWTGGHRLQTAVNVAGTYTNVPQIISANSWTNISSGAFLGPWTNTFTDPTRFFRLVD